MTYPDDLTTVTVRHTVTDTSGRPSVGPVLVTLTDRLWTDTGTIVPTKYVGEDLGDGLHEFVVPALDQDGITPQGAALRITEQVPGTPRPFYILPLVEHAAAEHVWARDIMSPPPKPGGGISYVAGPATDSSMADVADDPESQFRASLTPTIGAVVADEVPGAIADIPDVATAVADKIEQRDLVTATSVRRIIASADPDEPLEDGDLLLVYEPPKTLVEDFSGGIGDWTPRWGDAQWSHVTDPASTGGAHLEVQGATQARRLISMDAADSEQDANVEVVARVRAQRLQTARMGPGLVVRGSGTAGVEHGYGAYLSGNDMRMVRYVDGSYTLIEFVEFFGTPGEWIWVRLRAIGPLISMKAWADSEDEPDAWHISVQDSTIPNPGWVGASTSSNDGIQDWDAIGVAFDGATAPKGV